MSQQNLFGEDPIERKPKSAPRGRVDFKVERPFETSNCGTCGDRIVFVKLPGRSKAMPLHYDSALEKRGELRLESHFAHCSQADAWRRRDRLSPCANKSCAEKVPADAPFCGECWALLTFEIRAQIKAKFDPKQIESDSGVKPSEAYWQTIKVGQLYLQSRRRD